MQPESMATIRRSSTEALRRHIHRWRLFCHRLEPTERERCLAMEAELRQREAEWSVSPDSPPDTLPESVMTHRTAPATGR